MVTFSIVFSLIVKVRKKYKRETSSKHIHYSMADWREFPISQFWTLLPTLFCIRFLFLALRQLATKRISFKQHTPGDDDLNFLNNHINTFSSAFVHPKCVSKLSVLPKSWFFFSGTCDKPLVWNSSKRQIERHLWYRFFTKRKTILF